MLSNKINNNLFRAFIEFYWLRPENAAVKYYQSHTWSDIKWKGKSIDICCGDGVYVFLHQGGRFNPNFDCFTNTNPNFSHEKKFIDIYDYSTTKYKPRISKKPKKTISLGTDWKNGMISKSKALNIYDKLLKYDNNKTPLPFKDNEFDFIHSNALYWTRNAPSLLKEAHRILDNNSMAVLEFSTENLLSTIFQMKPILDKKAFDILDRQRSIEMKGIKYNTKDWISYIKKAGFIIEDIRVAWPNKYIVDFWNTGLRPYSHLLIDMANSINPRHRLKIKEEWVNIFYNILKPLCERPKGFKLKEASYITFILRKK